MLEETIRLNCRGNCRDNGVRDLAQVIDTIRGIRDIGFATRSIGAW